MVPPKSKLGQNFLRDEQAIRRIVAAIGDCSGRTVVEIGPGRGAITRELAIKAGRVVALELDAALAVELAGDLSRSDSEGCTTVRIENVDVLTFDFRAVSDTAGQRLLVVGNLPYYITSPILLKLAENACVLDRAVLMVQREVAERVTAKPGTRDYGLLSVTVQLHGAVTPLFTLPPTSFSPSPEVHSTVFRWQFSPRFAELAMHREAFLAFLRRAFALKRKTLANNLRAAGMEMGSIGEVLSRAGVEAQARAEALTIETLAAVWREIQKEGAIPFGEMAPLDRSDL